MQSRRPKLKVLVTGSRGFIGKNLCVRLRESPELFDVLEFHRDVSKDQLPNLVLQADIIVHLAGENRPVDVEAFAQVNVGLTEIICSALRASDRQTPVLFASSTQAELENPYGKSKLEAESILRKLSLESEFPVGIYRLPNVFGKWCKPNYNSVVATFAHNIANDLPIQINDSNYELQLVYIDDVVASLIDAIRVNFSGVVEFNVDPVYRISLGDLAAQLYAFSDCRDSLVVEPVGTGLTRALYSTYVSYLPVSQFAYSVERHEDSRGVFVEMLKTKDSGQFSFFTAHPGITRGGHYHHSKTEKFLVIKGMARFGFRQIISNQTHEIVVSGEESQIVETIPGWTHNITNIGDDELLVMLWANEIFDREKPDTINCKVDHEEA